MPSTTASSGAEFRVIDPAHRVPRAHQEAAGVGTGQVFLPELYVRRGLLRRLAVPTRSRNCRSKSSTV